MHNQIVPRTHASYGRGSKPQKPKRLAIEIASLSFFALAVFSFFALLSYHPSDPSLFTRTSEASVEVLNACGWVGAWLAALFLQLFGLGGFLLPGALIFIAVTLHEKEGWVRVTGILGGMSLCAISLTVFLALQWKSITYSGASLLTGGIFGAWIAQGLTQYLNHLGASVFSLFVFGLTIAFCTPVSLARFLGTSTQALAIWSWKAFKVLGTYFLYLLGIFAIRVAHSVAYGVQHLMEQGLRRIKERQEQRAAQALAVKPVMDFGVEKEVPSEVVMLSKTAQEDLVVEAPEQGPEESHEGDRNEDIEFSLEALDEAPKSGKKSQPEIVPYETPSKPILSATQVAEQKLKRLLVKKGPWKLPLVDFLRKPEKAQSTVDREQLLKNSEILVKKLADFGITGEITAVRPGPVITLYEFKPGAGIKVSKISALSDDLSMALSAESVRILAPLPGKAVVGIEIPSLHREKVVLREFLQDPEFSAEKNAIPVVMGKDISGHAVVSDLAKMPHLLCAGATGSGKSVFMNALICSLFYRFTPDELRMILVDPKFIEFRAYQDIPHLLLPVVDDEREASIALKWAVREMQRRYRILAKLGVKNLAAFNHKVEDLGVEVIKDILLSETSEAESHLKGEGSDWLQAFEPDENGEPQVGKLPYIVIIIDELADLVMVAKKDVELSINRIAQKARASGIHLVIATQRPSTDVVTGLIKVNLPSRISFQLSSFVDSKTILDRSGAECLLGQGDMLFIPPGGANMVRLQAAFVEEDEIAKVTAFLKGQGKPIYRQEILVDEDEADEDEFGNAEDVKFGEAVDLIRRSGQASASFIQRHLGVGYNRAAKMVELMESRGIVGPAQGSRPREIL